jgi:hypothetical protein
MFRAMDRINRPLPKFTSTMHAAEVPALLESSDRVAREVRIFSTDTVEPAPFAGREGNTLLPTRSSDLTICGAPAKATPPSSGAASIWPPLEAPTIHYFVRDVDSFRQIVASLKLPT